MLVQLISDRDRDAPSYNSIPSVGLEHCDVIDVKGKLKDKFLSCARHRALIIPLQFSGGIHSCKY